MKNPFTWEVTAQAARGLSSYETARPAPALHAGQSDRPLERLTRLRRRTRWLTRISIPPMRTAARFRLGLVAAFVPVIIACSGCQGPQGFTVGTHLGAGGAFEREVSRTGASVGTGIANGAVRSAPRRKTESGTYLYHEPQSGKTAPFTIGMSLSAAETLIRSQGIVMTRRSSTLSGGPAVCVLGPVDPSLELVVLLHFANGKLVLIESPS